MDLNLLHVFVTVANSSSFSGAATKLGVLRSSVSRSIASLESDLKVQLFSRTTRNVSLTTAGMALYAKIQPELLSIQESLGTLPEREELPSGALRITAPTDFGTVVLPTITAGFALRYPRVSLDVRLTNRKVDLVSEGFDIALRAGRRLSDSSLISRKVSDLSMQVVASPQYLARAGTPRSAEDAFNHVWVAMASPLPPSPLRINRANVRVESDDLLFILQSAKAGGGLSLLPTFLTRDEIRAGSLVRVLPRFSIGNGALYLLHPHAKHVPRKVTAFRDYLVEYLVSHPIH